MAAAEDVIPLHTTARFHSTVLILSVLLITLAHTRAYAVTQAGALLLTYPSHPRSVGMGYTGVADNGDPSTIYYNPANAVADPRAYLAGSKMEWPDDWFVDDMWVGRANTGFVWRGDGERGITWGFDVSLARLDYGEFLLYGPDSTPLGTFEWFEKAASLAFAVGIPSGEHLELRVGAAGKRWWTELPAAEFTQEVDPTEFDAYAFDAGITAVLRSMAGDWHIDPAVAVALVDAGPDYETGFDDTDPLPTRINFGANLSVESPTRRMLNADVPLLTVSTNLDGTDLRHGGFEWGMGTEIGVAQVLFLRGGVYMKDQDDDDEVLSSWGIGAGLPVSSLRLRFDYTESEYYFDTTTKHLGVTASWLF